MLDRMYPETIEINLPRKKVVELFDNAENLPKWQDRFVSMKHLEGEPGTKGAQIELPYKMGKREITMVETILDHNLPDHVEFEFKARGMENW